MLGYIKLMRPKQWVKNTFVFAAVIFSGEFLHLESIERSLVAFVLFVLASSATYVLNDIRDVESDRRHPVKSIKRPIASGEVSVKAAYSLLVLLYALLAMGYAIEPEITYVILGYIILNYSYSFYLKHKPVLDIFTIATGFVLRVYAGAVAIDVPVSNWMFITTMALTLYLAAIKRRQELTKSGSESRKVLGKYTLGLIDKYAQMSATCAIMFYSMFIIVEKPDMAMTIPIVLYGLYRYWYVVESLDGGESPTDALFSDIQLISTILIWIMLCVFYLV